MNGLIIEVARTVVGGLGAGELVVGAAVSLVLCGFVMESLRRTTGLPLEISALVVPVIVATGYGVAVAVQAFLDLSLLQAAGLLALVLLPLAATYERFVATV